MTYKIRWEDEARPDLDAGLRADLDECLDGEPPSNLIFHTWIITDDDEGPSVDAYWDEESAELVAKYSEVTHWVDLAEADAPIVEKE